MATLSSVEAPGDAELISAVRGGDVDAYGLLFERHADAARRLARQLVSAGDVEDLVSEAFVKVLTILQRGGGPDVAFRAYLLTSVRRLRVDRARAGSRLQPTDEIEAFDPGVPFRDTVVEGFESEAAARAFASLPERWQLVLWHTEVEGQKPADVAPLLGMSPNAVSALAYRAREGLRQAFLTQHAGQLDQDTCRWTHQHLGGYIRDGLSRRDAGKVEHHLQDCRACMAIYLELTEVNSNLAGILAPVLLGGAAAGYLSTTTATKLGLVALVDRARDWVGANTQTAAASGAAAVVTAVAGTLLVVTAQDQPPPRAVAPATGAVAPGGPGATPDTGPRDGPRADAPRRTDDPTAPPADSSRPSPETSSAASEPTPDGAETPVDGAVDPTVTEDPTDVPADEPAAPPAEAPAEDPSDEPPAEGPGDSGNDPPPAGDSNGNGTGTGDTDTNNDNDDDTGADTGQEPDEDPTDPVDPSDQEDPTDGLIEADLSVAPHALDDEPQSEQQTLTVQDGSTFRVSVFGLTGQASATISVSSEGAAIPAALMDVRCNPLTSSCAVTADDPSVVFRAAGQPGAVLTFVVTSGDVEDAAPGNETALVNVEAGPPEQDGPAEQPRP